MVWVSRRAGISFSPSSTPLGELDGLECVPKMMFRMAWALNTTLCPGTAEGTGDVRLEKVRVRPH